jgi:hypothetical protein
MYLSTPKLRPTTDTPEETGKGKAVPQPGLPAMAPLKGDFNLGPALYQEAKHLAKLFERAMPALGQKSDGSASLFAFRGVPDFIPTGYGNRHAGISETEKVQPAHVCGRPNL